VRHGAGGARQGGRGVKEDGDSRRSMPSLLSAKLHDLGLMYQAYMRLPGTGAARSERRMEHLLRCIVAHRA